MTKIIFIGDSITEHGRFKDNEGIGTGYVRLIHDYLQVNYPQKNFQIMNKGISGDEVTHLQARWTADVMQEKPDIVSISIGINDAWGQIKQGDFDDTKLKQFTAIYEELINEVQTKTSAKVILMEPTIITKEKHINGHRYLLSYVNEVRNLQKKFNTTLVPLFEPFYTYDKDQKEHALTSDGIHMTSLGSMLMASSWMKTFKNHVINDIN